ncbi:MAG TPA: hypothetical protein VE961_01505, partial [Pyrinomonadaceae bacterium]|nr:hypothetical protein [Pyrinomonadaceae bacterium]
SLAAGLSLAGAGTHAGRFSAAPQTKPVFSSQYTPLTNCGSGMSKKEERQAEQNGSDIPSKCKGLAGYSVDISYSACSSSLSLNRGDENISLAMQAIAWKQKVLEWRLADGKPFAVILRVYEYAGNDLCSTAGKIKSETLMVQGLKGFEHIQESVDARTPNANVKAREVADAGYAKPKA